MKTLSTLALGVTVALGAAGAMASAANATTATTVKKPAAACVASKSKPCPQKHAGLVTHKKHVAGKVEAKKS